ncbi:hypothetical protein ANO11243_072160 [Dothideomycetidae sp. 11243]|nr:hypothetical protein ANO11243_072160 [fungal sp. No.11243]
MRAAVTLPSEPANTGLAEQHTEEPAYGVPTHFQPTRRPATDSASNPEKRTDPFAFGSRYLEEGDDIFAFNAWDHVEVDDTYAAFVAQQTAMQRDAPVTEFDKRRFNEAPHKWWDKFYSNNRDNFFKDRKWLGQEFPLLKEVTTEEYGPVTILEVGAGAGNTAFPIVGMNKNPKLKMHACDYSKKAVQVMRESALYDDKVMTADVWDAAAQGEDRFPPGLQKGSVDVIIMIFIFSALEPAQWKQALHNVWDLLKPGGSVLFRDYGRGDLAQVRFKKGRYLEENFYVRGDGTRVYFFEKEELEQIWSGNVPTRDQQQSDDIAKQMQAATIDEDDVASATPQFEVVNLGVDRRMLVNRQRRLKMYRCWMQGLFRKPAEQQQGS